MLREQSLAPGSPWVFQRIGRWLVQQVQKKKKKKKETRTRRWTTFSPHDGISQGDSKQTRRSFHRLSKFVRRRALVKAWLTEPECLLPHTCFRELIYSISYTRIMYVVRCDSRNSEILIKWQYITILHLSTHKKGRNVTGSKTSKFCLTRSSTGWQQQREPKW